MLYSLLFGPAYQALRYRAAWASFALIVLLGSVPGARHEIGVWVTGVVLHAGAYATLAWLLFTGGPGRNAERAIKAVATVALMGAIDETVQSFLPYRHGAIEDWMIDCSAAIVMSAALCLLLPRRAAA